MKYFENDTSSYTVYRQKPSGFENTRLRRLESCSNLAFSLHEEEEEGEEELEEVKP